MTGTDEGAGIANVSHVGEGNLLQNGRVTHFVVYRSFSEKGPPGSLYISDIVFPAKPAQEAKGVFGGYIHLAELSLIPI